MKRSVRRCLVSTFVPAAALVATLVSGAASAGAVEVRVTKISAHGLDRCEEGGAPPLYYVARRPNAAGLPTDDVAIVDAILESDTALPAVRLAIVADLSVFRHGDVRDVSKLFWRVAPDGTRVPLRVEMPVDEGLTPVRVEIARPIADRFVSRLPLLVPLRLRVFDGATGHELATSADAAWRLVSSAGESAGSAPGGTLVQLPGGAAAADGAQLAVLYGCETMPRVAYTLTGVRIGGRARTPGSRLKSVRVHAGTPDGPVVSEAFEDVSLPAIAIGRQVIDIPDVTVLGDEAATREFFVVVTFADAETDLVSHPIEEDEALPAVRKRGFYRIAEGAVLEAMTNIDYSIDLLTDGRFGTAD